MEFEVLGGAGANRYIRWRIINADFWKNSSCRPHYRDIALSRSFEHVSPTVHVDIRGGSPVGEYIAKILVDSRRIRGLVAQAFGFPNEVPCKLCEEHFRSSDSENRAGMWPFFGCHTLPGEDDCGNCLYIMTICNLRAPELKFLRARADRVPPIREDVTEESSPAINKYNGRRLARKILSS
ncbi:hypothetical protein F5Y11DRAFT_336428 [Daldinia sp. FL1419]|nr:hypothetical protein F5Y11DRAFT_336428 [Daldinia sp. FL1419]